ncbi:MAG: sensor histidine kinase [Nitrosomonadales bacterium]|nr:sensor histidine kinase [Nitrosomonadales bacterium]
MNTETMMELAQLRLAAEREAPGGKSIKYRPRLCDLPAECDKATEASCAPQAEVRWMANQLLSIQENERKRIAADLHDGLGQALTMIKFALAETELQLAGGAVGEATASLQRLRIKAHEALEDVRHVAMDLRPPMLDDLGLLPTLSWFFREFEASCRGVRVEKEFDLLETSIPGKLKITIFRIVQEACSNIVKYANADLVRVRLGKSGDALHFSIEDNGDGFDQAEVAIRTGADRGLGLMSMRERAVLSGGDYTMHSACGEGTRIGISWPFDELSDFL